MLFIFVIAAIWTEGSTAVRHGHAEGAELSAGSRSLATAALRRLHTARKGETVPESADVDRYITQLSESDVDGGVGSVEGTARALFPDVHSVAVPAHLKCSGACAAHPVVVPRACIAAQPI